MTCTHNWENKIGHAGFMDYGGPLVYGYHNEYRCTFCGRIRMKVLKYGPWYLASKRKDNVRPRQLQLL